MFVRALGFSQDLTTLKQPHFYLGLASFLQKRAIELLDTGKDMRAFFSIFSMSLAIFSVGCGFKTGSKGNIESPEIEQVANKYDIICGPECNSSTAATFIYHRTSAVEDYYYRRSSIEYGVCTSWIAGEINGKTLMATNRHCVENIIEKASGCTDKVFFRFFKGNLSAKCERIVEHSAINTESDTDNIKLIKDIALIQLDRKIDLPAIKIVQQDIGNRTPVIIDSVDYNDVYKTATFKRTQCEVVGNSVLNRYSFSKKGPIIMTHGCDVISGNSGSVVKNLNHEAIGIVFGGKSGEDQDQQYQPSNSYDTPWTFYGTPYYESSSYDSQDENDFFRNVNMDSPGYFTNFACLDSKALGLTAHNDCAQEIDESFLDSLQSAIIYSTNEMILTTSKAFLEAAEIWSDENSGYFNWTTLGDDPEPGVSTLSLTPQCYNRVLPEKITYAIPFWTLSNLRSDTKARLDMDVSKSEAKKTFSMQISFEGNQKVIRVFEHKEQKSKRMSSFDGRGYPYSIGGPSLANLGIYSNNGPHKVELNLPPCESFADTSPF